MTNVDCHIYNKSRVAIHECRLRAINRHKTIFNLNGSLLYSANEVTVELQVFKKANGYKPWLYKSSIDACRFFRKPYNPIAILVYKLFKEFSNINHTCPYVASITPKNTTLYSSK
ncbi:GH17225 [Drosophila grimshawi]|uniref:GH17225 n=1 Tax=Drosophila grimshawi TaxID=7222 RepID=B4JW35_DROGR|nr:GH17225 [Drosophila grimshawi]